MTRVTIDIVPLSVRHDALTVLLSRGESGYRTLPGDAPRDGETLEACAARTLSEHTEVGDSYLEQLFTFDHAARQPVTRAISVSYLALVPEGRPASRAPGGTREWVAATESAALAPAHRRIVETALQRLRAKVGYSSIVLELMADEFTLSRLQRVCEVVLDRPLDKRNFRKRMLATGWIEPTGRCSSNGSRRPAMLYRTTRTGSAVVVRPTDPAVPAAVR